MVKLGLVKFLGHLGKRLVTTTAIYETTELTTYYQVVRDLQGDNVRKQLDMVKGI